MRVWDYYVEHAFTLFFEQRGVDLPRAWSLYCRSDQIGFKKYLVREYPMHYAAWRVVTGGN